MEDNSTICPKKASAETGSKLIYFIAVALGFSTLVVQIILLREFLSIFDGNELVIGIILSNWMVLTGTGAFIARYAGRFSNANLINIAGILLVGALPIITSFLISYLKNQIFTVGSLLGVVEIFLYSFILLLPFCVLSGFLFTHLSATISEIADSNLINKIYAFESLGSILGGILFNILLIFYLDAYESLLIVFSLDLGLICFIIYKNFKRIVTAIAASTSIALIIFLTNINFDLITAELIYPDQKIEYNEDTPFGNLVITSLGDQKNIYDNNVLIFSTNEVEMNEEIVHYAMVHHPSPGNVLLISGGISGTIEEILKYDVNRVDYVEINPWIIGIGEKFSNILKHNKVNTIERDGRLFVKETEEKYDVAIINLPPPATAQINRYYTTEFLRELKNKLNPGGILSLSSITYADYLSNEAKKVNSIFYNTLTKSFKNVIIIPGYNYYFVASDGALNLNIAEHLAVRGIENLYVNHYYIDDSLLKERSKQVMRDLDSGAEVNSDFSPVAYFQQINYWLSYFQFNYWLIPILICVLLIGLARKFDAVNFGIFCAGFAGSSFEILLILSFQVIYGYVYQMLGVIITIFFAGLAAGSLFYKEIIKNVNINRFMIVQTAITSYSVLFILLIYLFSINLISGFLIHTIFFVLTFLIALLVGLAFALATKIKKGNIKIIASGIYGIDLVGSAIGAILSAVYLVPLLGIISTVMILGLLNLIAAGFTYITKTRY